VIISVDPGEIRVGFCMFKYNPETKKADLRIKEILNGPSELYGLLNVVEGLGAVVDTVVCENYRIRPPANTNPRSKAPFGRSQSGAMISAKDFWSEALTIRVIGACEFFAQRNEAKFIVQEPKILAMGRKWCDFPVSQNPSTHIPDDIAAYIHGAHYMMNAGMIRSVDDIAKFGQEKIL
jgi:hypothetical protein